MRVRAKVLTLATALVTTFAILPTFGAAAADTLEDGSYDIVVEETTYTVEVVDGVPIVDDVDEAAFAFEFDDETGRVLDEFDLTIDGLTYEVEIADDGTVEVTLDDPADEDDQSDDDLDDDLDDAVDEDDDDDDEVDAEDGDDSGLRDGDVDDAAAGTHGELVSTVAHCAPAGLEAREAGFPNHGLFVSAAAQGDTVDFTVDGTSHGADFSTLEGAEEFCLLVDGLLASDDADTSSEDVIVTDGPAEESDEAEEAEDEDASVEADEPDDESAESDDDATEDDATQDDATQDDATQDDAAEDDAPGDEASEDEEAPEDDEDGTAAAERSREARDSSGGNG